jgi:hypothetical protein
VVRGGRDVDRSWPAGLVTCGDETETQSDPVEILARGKDDAVEARGPLGEGERVEAWLCRRVLWIDAPLDGDEPRLTVGGHLAADVGVRPCRRHGELAPPLTSNAVSLIIPRATLSSTGTWVPWTVSREASKPSLDAPLACGRLGVLTLARTAACAYRIGNKNVSKMPCLRAPSLRSSTANLRTLHSEHGQRVSCLSAQRTAGDACPEGAQSGERT